MAAVTADPLSRIRITGIVGFTHTTERPKFIGRNAKKDVHGPRATESAVRIYTDAGIDGIGFGRVDMVAAHGILGRTLAELWSPEHGMSGSLGRADHAVHDLVGKVLGQPVWKLLGAAGPEAVPVYDTTLYFSDLLPEHSDRGVARLVDELEFGLSRGFTAFKFKVGRGARWMAPDDGLRRDIEVVRTLARAAPPGVEFMADANDQFSPQAARTFLGEVGEHLAFLEEPFPESVREGCALRQWIADRGLSTRIADGESVHDPGWLLSLAREGALDVLQPDIRALGLARQCGLARAIAGDARLALAPHCWGSYLGTYKMLQLARGAPGILTCEIDPTTSDLFDDSAWRLAGGRITVPDAPGAGLTIREDVFRGRYLPTAWTVGRVG